LEDVVRRTKIVATIGPASESEAMLRNLMRDGMNVARLNFSHGSHAQHQRVIRRLRRLSRDLNLPVAILQDLCGPKLRVGEIARPPLHLQRGKSVTLTAGSAEAGETTVPIAYPDLPRHLHRGDRVLLDDGALELRVERTTDLDINARVVIGGELGSHKGINVPEIALPIPAVTEKDLSDLRFGLDAGVDWVAMSFVRSPDDLKPLRELMEQRGRRVPIIAKVEKHEAIDHIDDIIASADGVMVARGDLGVELPIDRVPALQKDIIERCSRANKPVITATQMLESMIDSPRPTRAEVSDVANAIWDGTDAVMLSGETAVGRNPRAALRVMARVAARAEQRIDFEHFAQERSAVAAESATEAIGQATCVIAADLPVKALITPTSSGTTPLLISKNRPRQPIIAPTSVPATRRRLPLLWGVHPVAVKRSRTVDDMIHHAMEGAMLTGLVKRGDLVVITGGVPGQPGHTNFIRIAHLGERVSSRRGNRR
jgi:pyruvate kinase